MYMMYVDAQSLAEDHHRQMSLCVTLVSYDESLDVANLQTIGMKAHLSRWV